MRPSRRPPFRAALVPAVLLATLPAGPGRMASPSVQPEASVPTVRGPDGVLHRYALGDGIPTTVLPRSLDEVSGLAFDDRGRLWAHDDETARIYELDPVGGTVRASFDVGRLWWTLTGDWEGLAWAEGRFFLVDSGGVLREFRPGAPGERVPYRRIPTGLGRRCEIEGLGYDATSRSLLLGCKSPRERALRHRIVVLAFSLATMRPDTAPRILTPTREIDALGGPDAFAVSAVEVHPATGTTLVASARADAVVEIARDGTLLAARRFPHRTLPQVEGLAVGPDGALLLASEGAGDRPRLARVPLGEGS